MHSKSGRLPPKAVELTCLIKVKFTCLDHEFIHAWLEKIDKAQVSGVPIDVIFDRKYIKGGYRFN